MKNHSWTFDKCPACGSTERIVAQADKALQDEGRIKLAPGQKHTGGLPLQVNLGGPSMLMSQIYQLQGIWDICAKCGTQYYVQVTLHDVPITVQMKQQPQQGPSPFTRPA